MSSPIDENEEPDMTALTEDEDGYEPEVLDEDIDDGQNGYLTPSAADDLYLHDRNLDDQDAASAADSQSRTWKIDPNFGQYHFKGE